MYDELLGTSITDIYENSKLSDRAEGNLEGTSGRRTLSKDLFEQRGDPGLRLVQAYRQPKSPIKQSSVREHPIKAGNKPHVKKYRRALEQRESVI